jgi:hypothetical protein
MGKNITGLRKPVKGQVLAEPPSFDGLKPVFLRSTIRTEEAG